MSPLLWQPCCLSIHTDISFSALVDVPSDSGILAVTGVPCSIHAVVLRAAVAGALLLLTSLLFLVFLPLLASILLLASLLGGWRPCRISVHAVVGVSALVGVLLFFKSLRKKIEKQSSVFYILFFTFYERHAQVTIVNYSVV
jgi:hypothetical protein